MDVRELKKAFPAVALLTVLGSGVRVPVYADTPEKQAEKLRADLQHAARTNKPLAIRPKVGVGPIRFGMTVPELKKAVGEPYRITGRAYEYQLLGLAVLLDRNDRVTMILVGAWCEHSDALLDVFKGTTREGVKLRSARAEIERAYGKPDSAATVDTAGKAFEVLKYEALRTQFALRRGRLVHITLKPPPE
jgi:hypothetical protein